MIGEEESSGKGKAEGEEEAPPVAGGSEEGGAVHGEHGSVSAEDGSENYSFGVANQRAARRYVRRLKLHYAAREVDSFSDLTWPTHRRKWALAATVRLERGQTSARIPLPAPLVAANLLIEYDDFYPQYKPQDRPSNDVLDRRRSLVLHCPRCDLPVTDAHGVCQHCGEVAFQCRQCRHINYERLDAFLCVECGYCAFGDFSYRLRSDPAPDAIDRSDEDLQRAVARLRDRAACADARRELTTPAGMCSKSKGISFI